MLCQFLSDYRNELIDRCRAKVSQRTAPKPTEKELEHGIPMFLDQLTKTLRVEQSSSPQESQKISGPAGGGIPMFSELSETAARHGGELLLRGYTVEQVVHDYGDLCQSITDLAVEIGEPIEIDEFRTLNRCLDNGIAVAVTEYNYQRDFLLADKQTAAMNVRLGNFAHELRNLLNTAMLALSAIKVGNVGVGGATGTLLDRSLVGLRNLIDRSLSDVRMTAGIPTQHELFSLADFIAEVELSASLEAQVKQCSLEVSEVDPELAVDGDRDLLLAAVGNLLQNAFKFTEHRTKVTLHAYAMAEDILIDIEDKCGGLPEGFQEKMFLPFTQGGKDQSGLGLGLTIAKKSIEANDGALRVRDVPHVGCVFTVRLPRYSMPKASGGDAREEDPFQIVVLSAEAKKLRILVAEDSAANRKLMEYVLEKLGLIAPVLVKNGHLAVVLCASGSFDVVLMDCYMPVLTGYEAAEQIRAAELLEPERKRVRIIGMSAAVWERQKATDAKMDDYLAKPLSIPLLAAALERTVASR